MRSYLSERNIVVILFILVIITFSLAHEDSKKMEQYYLGIHANTSYPPEPWFTIDELSRPVSTSAIVLK